jgi:hypothetical protein
MKTSSAHNFSLNGRAARICRMHEPRHFFSALSSRSSRLGALLVIWLRLVEAKLLQVNRGSLK